MTAPADAIAVTPGTAYQLSGRGRSTTDQTLDLSVNWYDSDGAYLWTSMVHVAVEADAWGQADGLVTAPQGAASARVYPITRYSTPIYPPPSVDWADVRFTLP